MSEIIISPGESQESNHRANGYLSLPYEEEHFKEFIISLLGQPQEMTQVMRGGFIMQKSDIENLHQLIDQRIRAQNQGTLIQFSCKMFYSDNSAVKIGSFGEFQTFNEIKPVVVRRTTLSWTYLIKFPEKNHPEKQTIEIIMQTGNVVNTYSILGNEPLFDIDSSYITTKIEHTNRTWGYDIENMLVTQMKNHLVIEKNIFRIFLVRKRSTVSFFCGVMLLSGGMIGYIYTSYYNRLETLAGLKKISLNTKATTGTKLNFISEHIINTIHDDVLLSKFVYFALFILLSFISSAIVMEIIKKLNPMSYLLLTRESIKDMESQMTKDKWIWMKFWGAVGLNLALGIISAYLYDVIIP